MGIPEKISGVLRVLSNKSYHRVSAVIVAAGSGSRMNSETTKQFMRINGIPVIIHTLLAFENSEYIDEIVIVAREDELSAYPALLKEYGITKVTSVVKGGATRQASVALGVEAISPKSDFIAIHDGARPLITPSQIKAVILSAYKFKAASAASVSKDTPKMISEHKFIEKSVDRDKLWLMQTPQVFYADLYRAALYYAYEKKFESTDDTAIAEFAGFPVKVVDCGYDNIKITTPIDLKLAELIINERNAESGKE